MENSPPKVTMTFTDQGDTAKVEVDSSKAKREGDQLVYTPSAVIAETIMRVINSPEGIWPLAQSVVPEAFVSDLPPIIDFEEIPDESEDGKQS